MYHKYIEMDHGHHMPQISLFGVLYSNACTKLECERMPNVMAAQPNIGGAFGALCESSKSIPCTTPQSLADARCSSAVQ